jgi:hypothetical protein
MAGVHAIPFTSQTQVEEDGNFPSLPARVQLASPSVW